MIALAARLTVPVPLPVAPANLPVPPTIVCVISRKTGAFAPAADDPPGEITPTMLSWITSVLPSSNAIVRTAQFGPQASKTMHWLATWPSSLIVALPHDTPAAGLIDHAKLGSVRRIHRFRLTSAPNVNLPSSGP